MWKGQDLTLGTIRATNKSLVMSADQRGEHMYVAGATGVGKSKFLEYLIRQDILANRKNNCGMLLIDAHGSLYDGVVGWAARYNLDRPIITIDFRQHEMVVAYNVLRRRQSTNPSVLIDNFIQAMSYAWGQSNTNLTPLFARWATNLFHVLYEHNLTLTDAIQFLVETPARRMKITEGVRNATVRREWQLANQLSNWDFDERIGSTINRLHKFISNEEMRLLFGQTGPSFDFSEAIEKGMIVLVCLAGEMGHLSNDNRTTLGTLLLTDLWTAAEERGKRDPGKVKPFYVYIDEFQKFVTPTIAENLNEARGFGLHLTLAHQFPLQLLDEGPAGKKVYNSVMENARSKAVFHLSDTRNLEPLAQWLFMRVLDPNRIKHELSATKVLEYREEIRTTQSRSVTNAKSFAEHESTSSGDSSGRSESFDPEDDTRGYSDSTNAHLATTAGQTHSVQESVTEGSTDTVFLRPILGKELSSVQFSSLEEQIHFSMLALFDQQQRQFTVRLRDMKAPLPLITPNLKPIRNDRERVDKYLRNCMKKWPCVLSMAEATERSLVREARFKELIDSTNVNIEPTTSKRKIAKKK